MKSGLHLPTGGYPNFGGIYVTWCRAATFIVSLAMALLVPLPLSAQEGGDAASLAKTAQNPIADMISVPFQNNTKFKIGPLEKTQNILNILPVYPINLNPHWNLITRTIVPVIPQPAFTSAQDHENGIGDVQFSAFLSPRQAVAGWVWGAGVIVQPDTATHDRPGQGVWGVGPTAVGLHIGKTWLYGALIKNIWSVATDDGRERVNQMLLQPFVNYNFPEFAGRYLTFSPIITANWKANSRQQ